MRFKHAVLVSVAEAVPGTANWVMLPLSSGAIMLGGSSLALGSGAFGCFKLASLLEVDIGCARSEASLCFTKMNSRIECSLAGVAVMLTAPSPGPIVLISVWKFRVASWLAATRFSINSLW